MNSMYEHLLPVKGTRAEAAVEIIRLLVRSNTPTIDIKIPGLTNGQKYNISILISGQPKFEETALRLACARFSKLSPGGFELEQFKLGTTAPAELRLHYCVKSFDRAGRISTSPNDVPCENGQAEMLLCMCEEDAQFLQSFIRMFLSPASTVIKLNGKCLKDSSPGQPFTAEMQTERLDLKFKWIACTELVTVELYNVDDEEQVFLYEMGIPLKEIYSQWGINVLHPVPRQTVPRKFDNEYLRTLYGHIFNHLGPMLTKDDLRAQWVRDAASSNVVDLENYRKITR